MNAQGWMILFQSCISILIVKGLASRINESWLQLKKNQLSFRGFKRYLSIFNALDQSIPIVLVDSIYDYDNDEGSYLEIYDEFSNQFRLSDKEKDSLKFNDKDFLKNLCEISTRDNKAPHGYFSDNLEKIIFKWIIYASQTFKGAEFQEIIKKTQPAYELLIKKFNLALPKSIESFYKLRLDEFEILNYNINSLLYFEFLDNGQDELANFNSLMKEFYHETGNCQLIKKRYFGNHFNNNFLLKLLILRYDTIGEMKKCFNNPNHTIRLMKNQIFKPLESRIISHFSYGYGRVNKKILKFYKDHGYRFKVHSSWMFCSLITSLHRINSLNKEILESVLGFPDQWNSKKFLEYYGKVEELDFNFKDLL